MGRMGPALWFIAELYKVEDRAAAITAAERLCLRQIESKPILDQLQATPITEDGAWIYPAASGGENTALVAWWYGGVLQNLDLVTLPPTERPASLKEQLMQMAWAGEMEGWLSSPPRIQARRFVLPE